MTQPTNISTGWRETMEVQSPGRRSQPAKYARIFSRLLKKSFMLEASRGTAVAYAKANSVFTLFVRTNQVGQ
jgi:hypothetical protein